MFCEQCGKEVQDGDLFCGNCGAPIKRDAVINTDITEDLSKPAPTPVVAAPVVEETPVVESPVVEVAQTEVPVAPAEPPVVEVAQTEVPVVPAEPPVVEAAQTEIPVVPPVPPVVPPVPDSAPAKEPGNKKKTTILMIVAACVAVVALLVICNLAVINNFVRKTISSPEKYYRYVESKTVKSVAKNASDTYDNYITNYLDTDNKEVTATASIELGADGEDLLDLAGLAGVDLSWLKKAEISASGDVKGTGTAYSVALSLNKEQLLSANVVLDGVSGMGYLTLPEFNPKAISVDVGDYADEYVESLEKVKELNKAVPNAAAINNLIARYGDVILDNIDDVKLKSKKVSAEGVSAKCTELKVSLDRDDIDTIAEAVGEAMEKDKDLQKYVANLAEVVDEDIDVDRAYEEFVEEAVDAIKDFGYLAGNDKITMKVYVNGKGEIVGRDITYYDWNTERNITVKKINKGSSFGYECDMNVGGDVIEISGTGKDNASVLNGEFEMTVDGHELGTVKVENLRKKDAEKGLVNGQFTFALSSELYKEMGISSKTFKEMNVILNVKSTKNSVECVAKLVSDQKKYATVTMAYDRKNSAKVSIPSKAVEIEDMDDLEDWMEDLSFKTLEKKLDKIDAPEEAIDALEEIEEAIEDGDIRGLYYSLSGLLRYF